jgi:hypothetical protein
MNTPAGVHPSNAIDRGCRHVSTIQRDTPLSLSADPARQAPGRRVGVRHRRTTAGRPWSPVAVRASLRHLAETAGVRGRGIDNSEIINTVYGRPAPVLPAIAGLR